MRRVLAMCCCGASLAAPAGASAALGPVPPAQGGAGVSAPGGAASFVALGAHGRTVVARVHRAGGAIERWGVLEGRFGVPGAAYDGSSTGLSADGRTLVVAEMPGRPTSDTRLVVLDARRLRIRARLTLPGAFAVDAISPDARWLYFIHSTSRREALRYEVRAYDLRARRLIRRPVVDPREPDEAMRGLPVTRAMSADGRWAYTLYDGGGSAPFVHALDTERRSAACIDLPTLAGTDLSGVRMTLGRGGAELRVGDAVVDTRTFAVRSPAAADPRPAVRRAGTGDDGGAPWVLVLGAAATLAAVAFAARRAR